MYNNSIPESHIYMVKLKKEFKKIKYVYIYIINDQLEYFPCQPKS